MDRQTDGRGAPLGWAPRAGLRPFGQGAAPEVGPRALWMLLGVAAPPRLAHVMLAVCKCATRTAVLSAILYLNVRACAVFLNELLLLKASVSDFFLARIVFTLWVLLTSKYTSANHLKPFSVTIPV